MSSDTDTDSIAGFSGLYISRRPQESPSSICPFNTVLGRPRSYLLGISIVGCKGTSPYLRIVEYKGSQTIFLQL